MLFSVKLCVLCVSVVKLLLLYLLFPNSEIFLKIRELFSLIS